MRARGLAVLALVVLALPLALPNKYAYEVAILVGLNALVCVGLNLLIGYAGQISLGHAGFWMVKTTHMLRADREATLADWESLWASLAFDVAAPKPREPDPAAPKPAEPGPAPPK